MGTVISNLKARFGIDTSDFKKGLKDGEKATDDFKDAAGGALDEFASMFGINMTAVNSALGSANKSLSFLGSAFTGAAKGGNILAISMKVLKVALISTGIGAIVVGLGSLIAYFTKSGEGADRFAKILAQVKSVFNNVIERIMKLGEGLFDIFSGRFKEGWEKMRTAFKGIGEEIKEDWKAAGKLADAEDALEDREIALITSLEERKQKIAELRLQAKEEVEDQKKKLSLLKEAEALTKSVYGDQVSIEKERLRIMKEKLAISSKDPTDEQRKEVAEQEAKINSLLREQAQDLKGIVREKGAALKIVNDEIALDKKKAEQVVVTSAAISNIKMPDFSQVTNVLAPLAKIQAAVKEVSLDLSATLSAAFESMAVSLGEFLGALLTGDAGIKDFGKMIAGAFADMAITVGKLAIGLGVAILAIKAGLLTLNPWVAIAAGIALVALGSAIRGALSNVATGGGSAPATSAGGFSYDTRTPATAVQKVQVGGKVELVASGGALKGALDFENNRLSNNT